MKVYSVTSQDIAFDIMQGAAEPTDEFLRGYKKRTVKLKKKSFFLLNLVGNPIF